MKKLLVLAVLLFCSACTTAGITYVKRSEVKTFKVGETTIEDVLNRLGPPTYSAATAAGQRTLSYGFANAQARPSILDAAAGAAASTSDRAPSAVTFVFGADRKLKNYSASGS
ncbi:MAG: hypothetical protein ABI612_14855 [Betaproteobacteria bacterium]